MEVGQPLIEQMVRVVDLAVANEVMVVALMSRLSFYSYGHLAMFAEEHENVVLISPIYRVSRPNQRLEYP